MSIQMAELLEPFERLLAQVAPLERVRAIEGGEGSQALWAALQDSGFPDALVSEEHGGAGVSLSQAGVLFQAAGRSLLPVAFAETVIARAMLADAAAAGPAASRPEGPIVLAVPVSVDTGYRAAAVPFASTAGHALVDLGQCCVLTPLAVSSEPAAASGRCHVATVILKGVQGSLAADLVWKSRPHEVAVVPTPSGGLRTLAAIVRAAAYPSLRNRGATSVLPPTHLSR